MTTTAGIAGLLLAACALTLSQAGRAQTPDEGGVLWLRPPAAARIAWRGMLPAEGGAVGIGPQIGPYVVPGVAGLLAAIATHATIMNSVQSAQRKREQEEADRVLEPYAAVLADFSPSTLWTATEALQTQAPQVRLWRSDADPGTAPQVEADAVFTMSADEGALLLDAIVKLPGADGERVSVVRVVSTPLPTADARAYWTAEQARALKGTAAAMFAHALQLAWRHPVAAPSDTQPMRTHRYLQASSERAERGQWLAGDCARAVLRNLRGGLMSVPLRKADDCRAGLAGF